MITVDEVYIPLGSDDGNSSQRPRKFQEDFIECIQEGNADVIHLVAPTGAGKTSCFEYLLNEGEKVLLLYPTNALIASQMDYFSKKGYSVATLSSKDLQLRGAERGRELWGSLGRHNIVLTNPDIFQAIIGRMYSNPEENLLDVFRYFAFVIYDEFHVYQEFELSGILMQIALFQNSCFNRVILSSATPKHEIINFLQNFVRIGKERRAPSIAKVIAEPINTNIQAEGSKIRYKTDVSFRRGKILDHFAEVVQKLRSACQGIRGGEPSILLIFDSVRDSNQFFRRLHQEYPDVYVLSEKDNGYDTNQVGKKPNLTKPILISTNKSEVGLNYPISLLFMEEGYNIASFIQRFGRAARHETAECYLFTRKEMEHLFPQNVISYPEFIETMKEISSEYSLVVKKVEILFTFRQALAINEYKRRTGDLKEYFASPEPDTSPERDKLRYSYTVWETFFRLLDKRDPALVNKDMDRLICFINETKTACQSLRGRALQGHVRYVRGHEVRQTVYDLLAALNRTPVEIRETPEGRVLEEISSESDGPFIQAITLPYIPERVEYPLHSKALEDMIMSLAKQAFRGGYSSRQKEFLLKYLRSLLYSIDPSRMLAPEEVILWDNRVVRVG